MTIAQAIKNFYARAEQTEKSNDAAARNEPLAVLLAYFSDPDCDLDEITPAALRDFLARWYIEQSSNSRHFAGAGNAPHNRRAEFPDVESLMNSLARFFKWARENARANTVDCMDVLAELEKSVPRALEISEKLSRRVAERGGPFSFPEFLTSFEEGGHSEYDIGPGGEVRAIEGFFRVLSIEGEEVEMEDLISEKRVSPVRFPEGISKLVGAGYILNLELARDGRGWQVAGAGPVYPPGTEI